MKNTKPFASSVAWILIVINLGSLMPLKAATNLIVFSEIKNGYENELQLADQSLENVDNARKATTDLKRLNELAEYYNTIESKRNKIHSMYLATQKLLEKFRFVDPQLYEDINSITDREGNATDVYVKVVDQNEFGTPNTAGTTNLAQSEENEHVYHSEYGDRSVSVKICITLEMKLLKTLAHEFGHVRYQVPNLSSYTEYFRNTYTDEDSDDLIMGHMHDDPSHQSVLATLKAFSIARRSNQQQMNLDSTSFVNLAVLGFTRE